MRYALLNIKYALVYMLRKHRVVRCDKTSDRLDLDIANPSVFATGSWVKFERMQFVGACNPPTDPGRKPLSHRFLRHVPVVYVDYPGKQSLTQIYGTFNRAMLRLIPSLRTYSEPLTSAMVEFYLMSQVK